MKINISLETSEINRAIKQIESYSYDLQRKCTDFIIELANIGITVARANTVVEYDEQYIDMGDLLEFSKEIVLADGVANGKLVATGQVYTKEWQGGSAQVNPLLMAEFGSGKEALGDWRGKFPNQKLAYLNSWWWIDNSGVKHESGGNVPSRPMFKAQQEMERQIQDVAYRVFKG